MTINKEYHMSNNIYQALPIMAMMTEATKRFPNWNRVLTLANNCDVMQKGGQLLQNLATGEITAQLPGQVQGTVQTTSSDGTVATNPSCFLFRGVRRIKGPSGPFFLRSSLICIAAKLAMQQQQRYNAPL